MLRRKRHVGQHIGLRFEEAGKLGQLGGADRQPCATEPCRVGIVLGEGGGDKGGDDAPTALADMRWRVAHEVLRGSAARWWR